MAMQSSSTSTAIDMSAVAECISAATAKGEYPIPPTGLTQLTFALFAEICGGERLSSQSLRTLQKFLMPGLSNAAAVSSMEMASSSAAKTSTTPTKTY